jgi:hypothetical protein
MVTPPSAPKLFIAEHTAYVNGYSDGTVRPQRNITRAEVVTIFYRVLLDDVRADYWAESNPFSDVSADDWFNYAVSVMSEMKIVNGYSDGTFKPNGNITRAELAVISARFIRLLKLSPTNEPKFSDVAGHWAETDIMLAASVGWLRGDASGAFRPDDQITRAELMALVNRILNRGVESEQDLLADMVRWPDNSDPAIWYYFDVQEATNSHDFYRKSGDYVLNLPFEYEHWTKIIANRDWAKLAELWSIRYQR